MVLPTHLLLLPSSSSSSSFSILQLPPCPSSSFLHSPFLPPLRPKIVALNRNNPLQMPPRTTPISPNRCLLRRNLNLGRSLMVRSQQIKFNGPLISSDDNWGIWTALFAIAAFGRWSEKTKIGNMVSAALVSILVGQAASNLGILPYEAPAYSTVLGFLLPLTIPLLLFRADMRRVIQSTGKLLLAFLLGSVGTIIGTLVAYLLVPMRSLGSDAWKIAAALMGSYIGGSVNYIAISEFLGVSSSVMAAGVAADNVVCAIYFMTLFTLASRIPPETSKLPTDVHETSEPNSGDKIAVLPTATAIAISFGICKLASCLAKLSGLQGALLPMATAIVVALATIFGFDAGLLCCDRSKRERLACDKHSTEHLPVRTCTSNNPLSRHPWTGEAVRL